MPEKEQKPEPKKEQKNFWEIRPKKKNSLNTKKKSVNRGDINRTRDRKRPYSGEKTNSTKKLKKKDVRFGDNKVDTFTPLNSDEKFDVHGRTFDCIEGHEAELAEASDSNVFGYEGQYADHPPPCGPEIEAGLNALEQESEGKKTWGGMVGRMGIKGRKGRTRKNKTKKSRGKSKRNAKRHAKSHKKKRNI
jgi:hypothetical protein